VQLTRDLVPVVFHDFSLSESGTDVPIHNLTFEQVGVPRSSKVSKAHYQSSCMQASFSALVRGLDLRLGHDSNDSTKYRSDNHDRKRPRARSLTTTSIQETHPIHNRMKYTVDFKNKGFKPNTRGSFIHGPFTNLKELLVNLPEAISFNVEISESLPNPVSKFPFP
jgi:glycerophosphodiester phosphodiesterase